MHYMSNLQNYDREGIEMEYIIIALILLVILVSILCYIFYRINRIECLLRQICNHVNEHDSTYEHKKYDSLRWWHAAGYK